MQRRLLRALQTLDRDGLSGGQHLDPWNRITADLMSSRCCGLSGAPTSKLLRNR
jgi:hypothetical protein